MARDETRDEIVPVDIDLLADYIGGALDGTDHDEVTRLVADDPRWRETYELLVPGMDAAATGLHALGESPQPMPADVAARIDEALTTTPRLTLVTSDDETQAAGDTQTDADPAPVPRPRRSHRAMRWAAPIAIAAGVLAFAGFGVQWVTGGRAGDQAATSQAGGAAAERDTSSSADQPAPMIDNEQSDAAAPFSVTTQSSGTNYTAATLGTVPLSAQRAAGASKSQEQAPGAAPAPLARLSEPAALDACIAAILEQRTGGSAVVDTIDLAAYEGQPAIIVRVSDGESSWVYAAGPDCGAPERGADVRNQVQVR